MKPFWIKERYNPQLGVYYVGEGQMSRTAAKRHERPLYGENIMHEYPDQKAYEAKLAELRKMGKRVHP